MNQLQPWLPLIGVALLSGLFNLPIAIKKLFNRCKSLPFFNPWQSIGFWLAVLINLGLPPVIFKLLYSVHQETPITLDLVTKSMTVGLVFTAFVNANFDLGFFGVDVQRWYAIIEDLVYIEISSSHTGRATEFTEDFKDELVQGHLNIAQGLSFLDSYARRDISLSDAAKQQYSDRITAARQLSDPMQQAIAIENLLLEIRRPDLPTALKRFNCSDTILKRYFPNSQQAKALKANPQRHRNP
jgi:hypothetical protein